MWHRAFASATESTRGSHTSLRKHLGRLWLRVHPDLFQQNKQEQSVNQASFQTLQAALAQQDTENGHVTAAKLPKLIQFYYRPPSGENTLLRKASVLLRERQLGASLVELFRAVELEPPPSDVLPRSAGSGGCSRTRSGQPRRRRRASAVYRPAGHVEDDDEEDWSEDDATTLRSLVRTARRVGMEAMQARHDGATAEAHAVEWAARDESLARLVLQRMRGVSISFGGGLPKKRGEAIAIERLTNCLGRKADADLSGLAIVLNGGVSVELHSPTASLTLGLCASDRRWDKTVHSLATQATAMDRRAIASAERLAARQVGVLHILYEGHGYGLRHDDDDFAQRNHVAYRDIIYSLAAGGVAVDGVENLAVLLIADCGGGIAPVDWDDKEGVLRLGIRGGVAGVAEAIAQVGVGVSRRHSRISAAAEAERAMVWRTARALRINVLRRGDGISARQWERGLGSLLEDAGRVGGILDRSEVVIGKEARVLPTGEVMIPWNFPETLPL
jgi:Domain of unknown function (DUF4460)/Domain of unknown function (DUF4461)